MKIINIGILAHVDAGKTTLTESLLYASGAISEPGSVEKGTTRTDTMFLERQRGITIQAAVTSFQWHRCKVNIVDTPGHMDFLAEVYRSLAVLDGAILVISAKDGVQAQTRILFHALRKMNIPTVIFINKIDQAGVDKFQQGNKVHFLGGGFVPDVAHQRAIQKPFCLYPKILRAFFSLTFGIRYQRIYQLQNIFLAADIHKGVVVHRFFEVNRIQYLNAVARPLQQLPALNQNRTFRVG